MVVTAVPSATATEGARVSGGFALRRGAADALLVVPGLGMRRRGRRAVERFFARQAPGFDVFVADYVARGSLGDAEDRLATFVAREALERYPRLHLYANILGAWAVNDLWGDRPPANLRSAVYDRSPLQERAPPVLARWAPWLVRPLFGSLVEDLAAAPYPPLPLGATPELRVGLLIETRATLLMRALRWPAMRRGPLDFAPGAFGQPHHDRIYLPFDHDEIYTRIGAFGHEIVEFARHGRFSAAARRDPPDDPAEVWRW